MPFRAAKDREEFVDVKAPSELEFINFCKQFRMFNYFAGFDSSDRLCMLICQFILHLKWSRRVLCDLFLMKSPAWMTTTIKNSELCFYSRRVCFFRRISINSNKSLGSEVDETIL